VQFVEGQLAQNGVDRFHFLLSSHSARPVCPSVAQLAPLSLFEHAFPNVAAYVLLFSPLLLWRQQRSGQWART
jgi:hypothetical protein